MDMDEGPPIPDLPLQIGDSDQFISGLVVLPVGLLVEITIKDVTTGQVWRCGPVPAPAPLEDFGQALNTWRGSITYPVNPEPPTRTLDKTLLRPYCLRYRQAYELRLAPNTLQQFRLQLFKEWEASKQREGVFPFGPKDRTAHARSARKAERRNFNDALDGYLAQWKQNKALKPYQQ